MGKNGNRKQRREAQKASAASKESSNKAVQKASSSSAKETTGYVIESREDFGKVIFQKILIDEMTVLAYKPEVIAPIGAKVTVELVPYFDKKTAKNMKIKVATTKLTPYLQALDAVTETEEIDSAKTLFPSQICNLLLKNSNLTGDLCTDLGFNSIVGRVIGGSKIQFA